MLTDLKGIQQQNFRTIIIGLTTLVLSFLSGYEIMGQSKTEQTIDSLNQVLESDNVGLNDKLRIYYDLSYLYIKGLRDGKGGLEYGQKGLKLLKKGDFKNRASQEVNFNKLVSWSFARLTQIDSALHYAFLTRDYYLEQIEKNEAETTLEMQKLKYRLGEAYESIGHAYLGMMDYPKSLEVRLKAIEIMDELRFTDFRSQVPKSWDMSTYYHNMARLYAALGEVLKASQMIQTAIDLSKEAGDIRKSSRNRLFLLRLFNTDGKYEKCIEEARLLLNDSLAGLTTYQRMMTNQHLMVANRRLGRVDAAIEVSKTVMKLAFASSNDQDIGESHRYIAGLYQDGGDIEEAFKHYRSYHNYKVATLLKYEQRALGRLEGELEAQESQIKSEMALENSLERQRLYNAGLTVGSVVLIVIIGILIWNFKLIRKGKRLKEIENEKLKAEQEVTSKELELAANEIKNQYEIEELKKERLNNLLDYKKRQLTTITMARENLNSQLKKVYKSLEDLSGETKELGVLAKISDLMKQIKPTINGNNDWRTFQKHFESVHPKFFFNLKAHNESLTENELRHCAYVQMKLTNKEVANMHGISADSVKMARNRIKKKLGLEAARSLSDFLDHFSVPMPALSA